jgi:Tfp pilus assembly protein PilX
MNQPRTRRGAALAIALVTLLVATLIAASVIRSSLAAHRQSLQLQDELQAQWLAECAIERAAVKLAADSDYAGETWQPGPGAAEIVIKQTDKAASRVRIEVQARCPDEELRRALVRRAYEITLPAKTPPSTENGADAPENDP